MKIMSWWTYINGNIIVHPMGRTQPEKKYILDTVLAHLPLVTGSEGDMDVYVIQKNGTSSSCSCDEFGEITNNLVDNYGNKSCDRGWLRTQDEYILVVNGSFRDRIYEQTLKEFQNWLCWLAKRISVEDVLVEVKGYGKSVIIRNRNNVYTDMFESPSWSSNGQEVNWCEFMMWDRAKGYDYPMLLAYKYFTDEENDAEVERRMKYWQ